MISARRSSRGPLARHGRQRTSHPIRPVLTFLGAALAVVAVSTVSLAAYATWDVTRSVTTVSLLSDLPAEGSDGAAPAPPPSIDAIDGGVNMVLVGSDTRTNQGDAYGEDEGGALNDVTMLIHIAQDHSSATVVSFPRDLMVELPDCPDGGEYTAPINVALSLGGLPCVVLTVESLTGLSIPFAAMIEFNGVIEMSNALGGVPVCVAEEIDDPYTGVFLTPGTWDLKGADALGFLRTRHGVGDGSDIGRISSQQVFLSSMIRTIKSGSTLTDATKLYGLAKAAASNMTLSDRLASPDTMVSIALALKDMDLSKVSFVAYPNSYADWVPEGKVAPDEDSAAILFAALAADQPITLTQTGGLASTTDPNAPVSTSPPATDPQAPAAPTDPSVPVDPASPPAPPAPGELDASGAVVLPDDVKGQTAADYTCSIGNE
ncbi:hypothetical protein B5808_03180 [Cnuibacter physcomitrellae]|uniref:Cell envelope-related transcriptional attenuator domain-containing protein n=1 Tax=Cnuibacter physcomitrellae TaxID=1619308 RepID=A0A1X9LYP1_9MICO|nr:hypothetical protein B5808_03180 [Cnuibacter physcomitrellae]